MDFEIIEVKILANSEDCKQSDLGEMRTWRLLLKLMKG